MAKTEQKQMEPTPMAYFGPTVPGLVKQGMVFTNGVPPEAQKQFDELPELGRLMLPAERFAKAWDDVHTPGSQLGRLYQKAEAALREANEAAAWQALEAQGVTKEGVVYG